MAADPLSSLPAGFTIDKQESSAIPPPPDGFTIDRAKENNAAPSSTLERVGTGVADMVWGAGQLAAHALPKGMVDTDIVDQMVKDRESEYAAQRENSGSTGFDVARTVGNVFNPMNYFLGGAGVAAKAGLGARLLKGAAAGSNAALLAPVTERTEDFWSEKGKQGTIGAVTGAAIPGAGAAIGQVINPSISTASRELMKKGITPTIGEMLGGSVKAVEDKLMSLPVVGDVIGHARRGSVNDLNRTLYDMALEPIGQKSTGAIGREGVREVADKLSGAYNNLLTGAKIQIDDQFSKDFSNILQNTGVMMSNDAKKQFRNIVFEKVMKARDTTGVIDGDILKGVDSQLGQFASKARKSQDLNQQMIGDALYLVKDALRAATARSNPDLASELAKIDQGWSMYARIRDAAARTGSKEGLILPSTLDAAVKRLDMSVGKGGTAKGTAPMRAFSDQVNEVLGANYPDSGSAGRAILNLLLLGGGMHMNPAGVMMAGALTVPYMPGVKKATAMALSKRPEGAEAVAQGIRTGAQMAVPGMAQMEAQQ